MFEVETRRCLQHLSWNPNNSVAVKEDGFLAFLGLIKNLMAQHEASPQSAMGKPLPAAFHLDSEHTL